MDTVPTTRNVVVIHTPLRGRVYSTDTDFNTTTLILFYKNASTRTVQGRCFGNVKTIHNNVNNGHPASTNELTCESRARLHYYEGVSVPQHNMPKCNVLQFNLIMLVTGVHYYLRKKRRKQRTNKLISMGYYMGKSAIEYNTNPRYLSVPTLYNISVSVYFYKLKPWFYLLSETLSYKKNNIM